MSSPTPVYVVLGLVGEHGAGPHDLVRMMRRGGVYYAVSSSQLYAEPKRLARLGYLSVREEPGRTRARNVYSLTDQSAEPADSPGAADLGLRL